MGKDDGMSGAQPHRRQLSADFDGLFPNSDVIKRLTSTELTYKERAGPKVVHGYVLGDVIGQGSYGKVREALHRHSCQRFAIKILRRRLLRKMRGGEDNVHREIRLMEQIHHVNCLQFIEQFSDDVADVSAATDPSSMPSSSAAAAAAAAVPPAAGGASAAAPTPAATTVSASLRFGRSSSSLGRQRHEQQWSSSLLSSNNSSFGSGDKWYLVLELVNGGSLQQLLDTAPAGRLPLPQARALFVQLLAALEHLHGLRIVHRDVKPDNLLLTTDGVLKLSDFGVALQLDAAGRVDEASAAGAMPSSGALAFQPPEVTASAEPMAVAEPYKIDVWAAGIVLYLMVTGKFPFDGRNVYGVVDSVAAGRYIAPPDTLDPLLADLLRTMLHSNPTLRASLAQVRSHPWITAPLPFEPPLHIRGRQSSFADEDLLLCKARQRRDRTCNCTVS